jgi:pimeloyl-ACP methyl ester carboxylesterase
MVGATCIATARLARRVKDIMSPSFVAALGAGVAVPTLGLFLRYRRDMNAARARLAAVERHVISTPWGAVEYAERGTGTPVLVVHGIFQNCVSGLLSVRDLFLDRRVIAPSRFGYLGSSMPPKATPAAQADAFAALLDALDLRHIDVIGLSAGATSALQLALRHPERVKHLAVLVGNLPGSPTAVVQPPWTKRVNRQFVMWALRTFAPSTTARLGAAVPKEFAMSGDDVRYVTEFIDSLFPMNPEGYNFDLFVSNADVTNYNLEAINVPTLIAHTKDDQLASHGASQRAAERIPGARFVSLESGGHLMLGQQKTGRDELADFFDDHERTDRADRVAC